jgi:hypothetical protein
MECRKSFNRTEESRVLKGFGINAGMSVFVAVRSERYVIAFMRKQLAFN